MTSRLFHVDFHPSIYEAAYPSLPTRVLQGIKHPLSWIADAFNPARVCKRTGHVPGHDVFAFWDLDRYPGDCVGHACGRCGQLVD